ncbi:hypothetical protein [Leptospirillum ferriphilum]|uniref:Uncharacterized protein n=1 Tax=Leptospirillum ferriphilum (strain ML-04) TaxID=1048260 RepID=J9ZB32_LEPFM|nr:hypothetical protein [Leptospirillum ferriphilum]AFS52942.1 hypothetical protein LFML04_0707 [Leptospirillum ferriphilum ML-04]
MLTMTAVIDELAFAWTQAKAEESAANRRRLEIEEKILQLLEKKEEGSVTEKTNYYKVTATYKINRMVDSNIAISLADELTQDQYQRIFRWKADVDTKELRFLMENKPETYSVIARAVTAKPAKPTLKIEEIEQ